MENKKIEDCQKLIEQADAIVIGAGAGLSTSGGLNYGGKRFKDNFADFIKKYGLTDMYSSAFYPFKTLEERWAYMSRHIALNRYQSDVGNVYLELLEMVRNKEHFVVTTNCDAQFLRAGFLPEKIFATQGDYSKFQCSVACHDTLYDNKSAVYEMIKHQTDCKVPKSMIPYCPKCGEQMAPYLRIDGSFIENESWYSAQQNYRNFLSKYSNRKVVLLELGIGFNTPGIIRWPFEKMVQSQPNWYLIRINKDDHTPNIDIYEKGIFLNDDISEVIQKIANDV